MKVCAEYDIRFNYLSLAASILGGKKMTTEKALHRVIGPQAQSNPALSRAGGKWTHEDAAKMKAMREQGRTWDQIGDAFGIHSHAAFYVMKRHLREV